jgi:hypothetical protein
MTQKWPAKEHRFEEAVGQAVEAHRTGHGGELHDDQDGQNLQQGVQEDLG